MYMSVHSYVQPFVLSYTDLCCTENDAYNIVDGGKVVYEEIARWRVLISENAYRNCLNGQKILSSSLSNV